MKHNPYQTCLTELFGLGRFGIKLGLDTISSLLSGLGNPQGHFKAVHIAGTNGKGSVAATLSTLLQNVGFRIGLYTSPHLVKFNERIVINRRPVSDKEVVAAYEAARAAYRGNRSPTFFEYTTAMAFYEFARQKVDWAVIETGMGGRLDATNILRPAVSIITNISLEHRAYLGNTIAKIAFEKAGIIKPGIPVIHGARRKNAKAVIRRRARELSSPCFRMGKDFRTRKAGREGFHYYGIENTWRNLKTPLSGGFQARNASLALAALEVLMSDEDVKLDENGIRESLSNTVWPGRLEMIRGNPDIILDGAHNLAAAVQLGRYLKSEMADRRIILVVGILDDKPYRQMLSHILPACKEVIVTRPVIDRALPPEILASVVKEIGKPVRLIKTVDEAVQTAMASAGKNDLILVAGSLYVVGEARAHLAATGRLEDNFLDSESAFL